MRYGIRKIRVILPYFYFLFFRFFLFYCCPDFLYDPLLYKIKFISVTDTTEKLYHKILLSGHIFKEKGYIEFKRSFSVMTAFF